MTYAPTSLKKAQEYLHDKTGLAYASLGIVGDSAHDGGYHCGKDRVDSDDYSVDESSRDKKGLTNAASALDIGSWSGLKTFSKWLVAECKAGASDTKNIREVIYSPDGSTVKRWDRLGKRSSGDSSHRYHTHVSYFRDSKDEDKTALFKRYFEGGDSKPSTGTTSGSSSGDSTTDWDEEIIMALPTVSDNSAPKAARKRVQSLLAAAGNPPANSFDSKGRPDGDFGSGSKSSLKSYQRAVGLDDDGKCGKKTWTKLLKG